MMANTRRSRRTRSSSSSSSSYRLLIVLVLWCVLSAVYVSHQESEESSSSAAAAAASLSKGSARGHGDHHHQYQHHHHQHQHHHQQLEQEVLEAIWRPNQPTTNNIAAGDGTTISASASTLTMSIINSSRTRPLPSTIIDSSSTNKNLISRQKSLPQEETTKSISRPAGANNQQEVDKAPASSDEESHPYSQAQNIKTNSRSRRSRSGGNSTASTGSTASANSRTRFHYHLHPDDEHGFSACLLISEDNHYLIEWLAYHYWFLPLRRLIVAVDPASRTSPQAILDRYSQQGLMDITVWNNDTQVFGPQTSFWKKNGTDTHHDTTTTTTTTTTRSSTTNGTTTPDPPNHFGPGGEFRALDQIVQIPEHNRLLRHRYRQSLVFSKCLAQLKKENRTWVALVDTDEYITLYQGPLSEEYRLRHIPQNPTTLYRILNDAASPDQNNSNPRMLLHNTSCINMRRDQMSNQVTNTTTNATAAAAATNSTNGTTTVLPSPWNTSQFNTLQFRHRAHYYQIKDGGRLHHVDPQKENEDGNNDAKTATNNSAATTTKNDTSSSISEKEMKQQKRKRERRRRSLAGKCLVRADRILSEEWLRYDRTGPHRPTLACPPGKTRIPPYQSPLIVHHYPGTLEQFSFRQSSDPRQGVKDWARYQELSQLQHAEYTEDLSPTWVSDFIDTIGSLELGNMLLEGIGTVEKLL